MYGTLALIGASLAASLLGSKGPTSMTRTGASIGGARSGGIIGGLSSGLGKAGQYAMPLAILASAGSMLGWSGSNVYQTGEINEMRSEELEYDYANLHQRQLELSNKEDYLSYLESQQRTQNVYQQMQVVQAQRELDWEEEEFYLENEFRQTSDALDYQRDMNKILAVEEFDLFEIGAEQNMQTQRLQAEAMMQNQRLEQDQIERNIFLNERAFQSSQQIIDKFGDETDLFKLTYILTELSKLEPDMETTTNPQTNTQIPITELDVLKQYDYTQWEDDLE